MKKITTLLLFVLFALVTFAQSKSSVCKPDKVVEDKITKEKVELWYSKLASSSSFKSSASGKADLLYYIQFVKSGDKNSISIQLSQTSSFTKESFGDELRFSNQDKIVFGWANNKPIQVDVESVAKNKKVFEKANQVTNYYFLTFSITEENLENMKELFTNDLITGVRVVMANGSTIDKEVNDKMNVKAQENAKCFFDLIK